MLTLQLQATCLGQLGFYVNYQNDSLSFASSAEESICGAASPGLSGHLTTANLRPNFPQHIAPPSSDAMLAGIEGTRPNLDMGGGALGRPHRKPRRPEPRWRSGVSVTSAKKMFRAMWVHGGIRQVPLQQLLNPRSPKAGNYTRGTGTIAWAWWLQYLPVQNLVRTKFALFDRPSKPRALKCSAVTCGGLFFLERH